MRRSEEEGIKEASQGSEDLTGSDVEQLVLPKLSPGTESHRLLAPVACFVLFLGISVQVFSGASFDSEALLGVQKSVDLHVLSSTIASPDMVPLTCPELTQLPYMPSNMESGPLGAHSSFGYVHVSSFRLSSSAFLALGLSPRTHRSLWGARQEACIWVSYNGPRVIPGILDFHFVNETAPVGVPYSYDVIAIHCKLDQSSTNQDGGALFINIQGVDEVLVHREPPGTEQPSTPDPLPSRLTVCSTLLTAAEMRRFLYKRVLEHMQFLQFMGADSFTMYNGGAFSAGTVDLLQQKLDEQCHGCLHVVDMQRLTKFSAPWDSVTATDCAHRNRLRAAWLVVLAPDEFPSLPSQDGMLVQLLSANKGVPWVTLEAFAWDMEMCAKAEDASMLLPEHMRWRQLSPLCTSGGLEQAQCPEGLLFRRIFVDPRKVGLLSGHKVVYPILEGKELKSDTAQINKFVGLLAPASLTCEYPVREDHESTEWSRDDALHRLMQSARASFSPPTPGFTPIGGSQNATKDEDP